MSKILAFAGKMQSGKSTSAKFIFGKIMQEFNLTSKFDVDDDGDLIIDSFIVDENGNKIIRPGILDIYRRDFDFVEYAAYKLWPHVKIYSFANTLKESVVEIFGISENLVFGNNDCKNTLTDIPKVNVDGNMVGYLTIRELLQDFGALCRKMKPSCWIDACLNRIKNESPEYAIIDDCRHINEVKKLKEYGANIIKLNRANFSSTHQSEIELDSIENNQYDYIVDNQNLSMKEKNKELLNALTKIQWIKGSI